MENTDPKLLDTFKRLFFTQIFPAFIENRAPVLLKFSATCPDNIAIIDSKDIETQTIVTIIAAVKNMFCTHKYLNQILFDPYKIYLRRIIDTSCFDKNIFDNNIQISAKCNIVFGKKIITPFENSLWATFFVNRPLPITNTIIWELCTFSMANWYVDTKKKIVVIEKNTPSMTNTSFNYCINNEHESFLLLFKKILSFMPLHFTLVINDNVVLLDSTCKIFLYHRLILNNENHSLLTHTGNQDRFKVVTISNV